MAWVQKCQPSSITDAPTTRFLRAVLQRFGVVGFFLILLQVVGVGRFFCVPCTVGRQERRDYRQGDGMDSTRSGGVSVGAKSRGGSAVVYPEGAVSSTVACASARNPTLADALLLRRHWCLYTLRDLCVFTIFKLMVGWNDGEQ